MVSMTAIVGLLALGAATTAVANTVALIKPADSTINVTDVELTEDPAASFAVFSNTNCNQGQAGRHVVDGECGPLPGSGFRLWWLADTCRKEIPKTRVSTYLRGFATK
jgi:hypothetical protein